MFASLCIMMVQYAVDERVVYLCVSGMFVVRLRLGCLVRVGYLEVDSMRFNCGPLCCMCTGVVIIVDCLC